MLERYQQPERLSWQLFLVFTIFLSLSPEITSLDEEIYERQSESVYLAVTLTEKLVKFYNLTETFQEKFNRLARYDPYGEETDRVNKLIIHIQELAKQYEECKKLLANPSTRNEGKLMFDNLYHKSTDISEELSSISLMLEDENMENLSTNAVIEKAKEEYESLKADLEIVRSEGLNDFVDSSIFLADKKLFPESLLITDIKSNDWLEDVQYADSLMELHRLYKKCYELEEKALAANDVDVVDAFFTGKKAHELFYETIPAFIEENKIALSHVVPVTVDKMLRMEKQFRGIDIQEALDNEQTKLIERVLEASEESDKLSDAREAAAAVYHKYFPELSHDEREAEHKRKRDEL